MESVTAPTDSSGAVKRKRSPSSSATSGALAAPAAKSVKTGSQLSINYLARQSQEDLPLINKEEPLPNLLHLLSAYSNILDRHESLASNLGARPLGPILIKRFERCFDAPPKVVASHHKNASGNPEDTSHHITWLEVIEFARSHPGQFTLSTFSEGKRVCQFYYPQKQLRVQISEEDFLFINSGRCQELIPPLPIWEDEEKEVGTCDVLEAKLRELTNAADMVAARTRQLSHRLKGRRAAILERRAEGGSGTPAKASAPQTTTAHPSSSASGFVAVNAANGRAASESIEPPSLGSSAAVRNELLRHFESLPHNQAQGKTSARHHSITGSADTTQAAARQADPASAHHEGVASNASSLSPVPANAFPSDTLPYSVADSGTLRGASTQFGTSGHRPSSSTGTNPYSSAPAPLKHNFSRPLPPALESSQPFRPLCQAHMDSLPRGHRVLPPCDRCRRLRMDCVKNLTSCAGCTRKHARCHWRDVSREELGALDHLMESGYSASAGSPTQQANDYMNGGSEAARSDDGVLHDDSDEDDSNPLEDLEALGEKEEQEREDEEGLRGAKELARQGWEESLRTAQHSHDGDAATADEVTSYESPQLNGTAQDPDQDQEAKQVLSERSGSAEKSEVLRDAVNKSTYDPVREASPNDHQATGEPQIDPPTIVEQSISSADLGGFRAVNGFSG